MTPAPYNFMMGPSLCSTHTIPQLIDDIHRLLRDKSLQPRTLLYTNAHVFNAAVRDPVLRDLLNAARCVVADGIAIVWAAPLFGARIPKRCNMTEALRAFLLSDISIPYSCVLVGATDTEVRQAKTGMEKASHHCRIVQTHSGFLEDAEYRRIFTSAPDVDLILLGMATPKTERVSAMAAEICPRAVVWNIGAGTIKILAGTMKEAPVFFRKTGLQWLHRLVSDPKYLWKRYLVGNPLFIYNVFKAVFLRRKT